MSMPIWAESIVFHLLGSELYAQNPLVRTIHLPGPRSVTADLPMYFNGLQLTARQGDQSNTVTSILLEWSELPNPASVCVLKTMILNSIIVQGSFRNKIHS